MPTSLHGYRTGKEFLDSIYLELNITSPSSYYYDTEYGVRVISLALARAFDTLSRRLRKQDTYHWQAVKTITIEDDAPARFALPKGYIAPIQMRIGQYPIVLRGTRDWETLYHDVNGYSPRADIIPATRVRDEIYLHSNLVELGVSEVELVYYRELPLCTWAGTGQVVDGASDSVYPGSQASPLQWAYEDGEWEDGGIIFNTTQSAYTDILTSTTTSVTVSSTAFTAGTGKSLVLFKAPDFNPEALDALIAQTCLIIKGEDLNGWRGRVAEMNAGTVRRPSNMGLPKKIDQFRMRF